MNAHEDQNMLETLINRRTELLKEQSKLTTYNQGSFQEFVTVHQQAAEPSTIFQIVFAPTYFPT